MTEDHFYLCANTQDELFEWVRAMKPLCANADSRMQAVGSEPIRVHSLVVRIGEARDVPSRATHVYCIVLLGDVPTARTQLKPRTDAMWAEEFRFDWISSSVTGVTVQLFNKNKMKRDSELASVTIPIEKIPPETGKGQESWYRFVSSGDAPGDCGSVRIKAMLTNEVLLPLADYADLRKALMADDLHVLHAIGCVGKNRDELSRQLLRIFAAERRTLAILQALNVAEINATEDAATMFRNNSLASKTMDQFMKVTSIPYLQATIGSLIKEVFDDRHSCELDPSRLDKGADVRGNCKRLLNCLEAFWAAIRGSAAHAPAELRYLFSLLQRDAVNKFRQPMVRYVAVSAFIFLRFFCPAILNPKLFNMMPGTPVAAAPAVPCPLHAPPLPCRPARLSPRRDPYRGRRRADHPSESTARTLTLIAKCMQSLANLTEFGPKEPYMAEVNPFIRANIEPMKVFIDTLSVRRAAWRCGRPPTGAV